MELRRLLVAPPWRYQRLPSTALGQLLTTRYLGELQGTSDEALLDLQAELIAQSMQLVRPTLLQHSARQLPAGRRLGRRRPRVGRPRGVGAREAPSSPARVRGQAGVHRSPRRREPAALQLGYALLP
jgi:hypothetical protein